MDIRESSEPHSASGSLSFRRRIILVAAAALFLFGCAADTPSSLAPSTRAAPTPAPPPPPPEFSPEPDRGMDFPLRSVHLGGKYATNAEVGDAWLAAGATGEIVPPDFLDWLESLHVGWVGLPIVMWVDGVQDSTLEPVYDKADLFGIRTWTDAELRQITADIRSRGMEMYWALTIDVRSETEPPRWLFGEPDPEGIIAPEAWPWSPAHPDHERFVAEFWQTYTEGAVHFARLAEEAGVGLYGLGTETDRLFRTRSGGRWTTDFGTELKAMVSRVRNVYSGFLSYDMYYDALVSTDFYEPLSHLWSDLGLDVVGVSAYFPLLDSEPATPISAEAARAVYDRIFRENLAPLAARNPGKPIVFLEYGLPDVLSAPADPGLPVFRDFVFSDANGNGVDDGYESQANVYRALFETAAAYPDLWHGAFVWDQWMASDEWWRETSWASHRSYSIRGKPAEEVVRSAYRRFLGEHE